MRLMTFEFLWFSMRFARYISIFFLSLNEFYWAIFCFIMRCELYEFYRPFAIFGWLAGMCLNDVACTSTMSNNYAGHQNNITFKITFKVNRNKSHSSDAHDTSKPTKSHNCMPMNCAHDYCIYVELNHDATECTSNCNAADFDGFKAIAVTSMPLNRCEYLVRFDGLNLASISYSLSVLYLL